jgi:predicted nucleic acid-binding protein
MSDYLLDTTEIIDYSRGEPRTVRVLEKLLSAGQTLCCCDVVVAEVFAGVRPRERSALEAFVFSLRYHETDCEAARTAGEFLQTHARKGLTLGLGDALIAAVAVHNDLTLVTKNGAHYPMGELRLLDATAERSADPG